MRYFEYVLDGNLVDFFLNVWNIGYIYVWIKMIFCSFFQNWGIFTIRGDNC